VDMSDDRLVCGDCCADGGCDMIWFTVTEDADDFLAISDGQMTREIFES
jgi:hypothetical protein